MASRYRNLFKKTIQSKIKHIFDTSTRTEETLGLGGCDHVSRVRWEWKYFNEFFQKWTIGADMIQSIQKFESLFPNGIVIILRNNDYFTIKESTNPLDSFICSRIGSNELLSSAVLIESSECTCMSVLPLVDKLKETGLIPLSKKHRSLHRSTASVSSNAIWSGHYAINLKGGTQTKIQEGIIPLGNPIYDYASEYTQDSIEYQMVYMMLCAKDAHILLNDESKIEHVKDIYRNECERRGLLDFKKFGISNPISEDGTLICCVLSAPIHATDFMLDDKYAEESIQYCHIVPKSYTDVTIVGDEILTTFRPYNIGWGKKWANRWQGDDSVENLRAKIKFLATRLQ